MIMTGKEDVNPLVCHSYSLNQSSNSSTGFYFISVDINMISLLLILLLIVVNIDYYSLGICWLWTDVGSSWFNLYLDSELLPKGRPSLSKTMRGYSLDDPCAPPSSEFCPPIASQEKVIHYIESTLITTLETCVPCTIDLPCNP